MSRSTARRPLLLPTLRRLWRDPHRVQLGTDPARAVLLELANPRCARLLDLLDGSRSESSVLREAQRHGIGATDAAAVLTALRQAGFVVDAHTLRPTGIGEAARRRLDREAAALALQPPPQPMAPATALRRRLSTQVIVSGAGLLAVPIAGVLAASGIGHITPDLTGVTRVAEANPGGLLPSDAHRPRGIAAAEAIRRAAPEISVGPPRAGRATFAVLVGFTAPAALTAFAHARRRMPHLAVTIRDATVVVGPLVRPGVTACLNCLDLHRRDRDPVWPVIAAQLSTGPETTEPLAATTALAATAYAAAQVLAHVDGATPATLGTTVEISGPDRWTSRRWSPHPACGCRRRRRTPSSGPPGAAQ